MVKYKFNELNIDEIAEIGNHLTTEDFDVLGITYPSEQDKLFLSNCYSLSNQVKLFEKLTGNKLTDWIIKLKEIDRSIYKSIMEIVTNFDPDLIIEPDVINYFRNLFISNIETSLVNIIIQAILQLAYENKYVKNNTKYNVGRVLNINDIQNLIDENNIIGELDELFKDFVNEQLQLDLPDIYQSINNLDNIIKLL